MSAQNKVNTEKNDLGDNIKDRVESLNDLDLSKLAYCPSCKACGDINEDKQRGSLIIGLLGVLAGGLPGLLYILFYLKNWKECRVCSNRNTAILKEWIKSNPIGNESDFIRTMSHYPNKTTTKEIASDIFKFIFGLIILFIFLIMLLIKSL